MHASILQDYFRIWWLHGTTDSFLPVRPWDNKEWGWWGTCCLEEGAGESETCFNCVLYGIGVLVNCPLLFPESPAARFIFFWFSVLPAWLLTQIFAAKVVGRTEVTSSGRVAERWAHAELPPAAGQWCQHRRGASPAHCFSCGPDYLFLHSDS